MNRKFDTLNEQCVWVDAGVLNYKLCDRCFDCEHCPLDAALRDSSASCGEEERGLTLSAVDFPGWEELPEALQSLLAPLHTLPLCDAARYSARHVWVRQTTSGMVRLGLDAFAAALLPEDAQLVTVANRSELREGEAFGWVYAWNKTLPLPAPVSGVVICRSDEHLDSMHTLRHEPYGDGCLLTVSPAVGTLATARVHSPSAHSRRIQRHESSIAARLLRTMERHGAGEIGLCLNDGGTPVSSLAEMLGPEGYWKLICGYIGGE
jgi:glycine cleavage system H lipoate-binding protein